MPFNLPDLPYDYQALEPHIDARTMEIHHSKHHQGYINNLNQALKSHPKLAQKSVKALLKNLNSIPEEIRQTVQNNGGGHANHSLFWKIMSPEGGGKPAGELAAALKKYLGGFNSFKEAFAQAAATRFGSGWAWLVLDEKKLAVISTANQDSPISTGKIPILGIDVWEHAYYLNYQNRRPDYIEAWWSVVNWPQVEKNYKKSQ